MFTVEQVVSDHYPSLNQRTLCGPLIKSALRRLLHEQAFINFAKDYPHLHGIEFIEQVLDYFHFSFAVSDSERENIPASGKVMIIANHPIGSLDGLALLKLVHDIRSDVKIVANNLLMAIPPLRSLLLPVRNMTGTSRKGHIERIGNSLEGREAVIMFPAGEVSRFGLSGIKDCQWQRGFLIWYGIGAFLGRNPQFRYLFGPVSISNSMPLLARELLIYFYKLYFSGRRSFPCSRHPFRFSVPSANLEQEFTGEDYREDFRKLKLLLNNLGAAVPTLYKQYTELCEPGGVAFLDFNIDPAFGNCVDGLVIVDTHKIKQHKRKRYIEQTILA